MKTKSRLKPHGLVGNQNASKGGISGVGRVVVDLGPLKARVVAEAQRRGPRHSLKSVIVDALERMLIDGR